MERQAGCSDSGISNHSKDLVDSKKLSDSKSATLFALIVEDDRVAQKVHLDFLERLGFTVDIAPNAKQALEFFYSRRYSVVLLDKGLPDQDGTQVCRAIRQYEKEQSLPSALIIGVTTSSSSKENLLTAGCDEFIIKPIFFHHLKEIVDRSFSKKLFFQCQTNSSFNQDNLINPFINQQKETLKC